MSVRSNSWMAAGTMYVMAKQATLLSGKTMHERVNTHHKGHAGDISNFCDFTHGDKMATKLAEYETVLFSLIHILMAQMVVWHL